MTNAHHHQHNIPALKERLLIPQAWQYLKLPGTPATRCRSPFRPDKTPSFSIYDGGRRWKDFATGEGGDVIDFIAAAMAGQVTSTQVMRMFLDLTGVRPPLPPQGTPPPPRPQPVQPASNAEPEANPQTDPPMHPEPAPESTPTPTPTPQTAPTQGAVCVPMYRGTLEEREQLAQTRAISLEAVSLAQALGTLNFGTVQGFRCWILTDADQRLAEARRLDGKPFPEAGPLGERKAHTLRGSTKNWPLGAAVLRRVPEFRTLLVVEGGPDYLAALHFATELERWDVLPVTMLGRSIGVRLHGDALDLMHGRRARLYPHADADGGGLISARLWATCLERADCDVDYFDFSELRRTDGKVINDLNDCTAALDAESADHLARSLFPAPDREVHPPY